VNTPSSDSSTPVSRRGFIKSAAIAGGGLVIGFQLWPRQGTIRAASPGEITPSLLPNAFLRIAPTGAVTVIAKHSEMGQGVYTSLAICIAEELDADWTKITVEAAPAGAAYANTAFGPQMTGGSSSTYESYDQMRLAGAAARAVLVQAAAAKWSVPASALRTDTGVVIAPDGRRASYGELVEAAAKLPVPEAKDLKLKDPGQFKFIGKSMRRIEAAEKVMGQGEYGIDVSVPGMLTAVIVRSPVFGGKVRSYDGAAAKLIPGVKYVVEVPSGVAVVADGFWAASKGAKVVKVEWNEGPLASLNTAEQGKEYTALLEQSGAIADTRGNVAAAYAAAATKIDRTFEFPYLAHAAMEPLNATVHVRSDRVDVWAPTQFQSADVANLSATFGVKPENVSIHTTLLGGGFGRKATQNSDFVVEAAHVSKAVNAPVRVVWTREDDMKGGYYRPRVLVAAKVGVDAAGNLTSWENHVVSQSLIKGTGFEGFFWKDGVDHLQVEGLEKLSYGVPNLEVRYHLAPAGVPVLWWRSVGHSYTAFVKETLVDEAAFAARKDPIEYRIGLLGSQPRHVAILELLREKSNWGHAPQGRFHGVAIQESFKSIVGEVAEISIEGKEIRVHRVTAVVDCGFAVNPDGVRAQIMSAVVFGMSAALGGKITFAKGRVEQGNFDDYPVVRIDKAPVVETFIINSGADKGGIGEPGTPPIAPAIANAVFAATKKRLVSLPLTLT
jgi:isoquinoline 1-oxidoreductase beta subunit